MHLAEVRNHLGSGGWGRETEDEVTARRGEQPGWEGPNSGAQRPHPSLPHTPPEARLWTFHVAHSCHLKWIVSVQLRTGSPNLAYSHKLVPSQGPRTGWGPPCLHL